MFLETSYFDEFNDVDFKNLAGYEERTRVHYMIRFLRINIVKEFNHLSITMFFCFFTKSYVISLCSLQNQCPKRVIMIIRKISLCKCVYTRAHAYETERHLDQKPVFAVRQRFRIRARLTMT